GRSAKVVGVVSETLSNTLISPLFSATNTRPSGANLNEVACASGPTTVDSLKFGGSVVACAATGPNAAASAVSSTTMPIATTQLRVRAVLRILPLSYESAPTLPSRPGR